MSSPLRAVIVGLGKAGGSLRASLSAAGIDVVAAHRRLPRGSHAIEPCDIVFLAVPDDALADVDRAVSKALARSATARAPLVVHLSGARGVEALPALAKRGAVGTFHPLASLDGTHAIPADTLIAVDATGVSERTNLVLVARAIGCVPAVVPSSKRALYHAGAVVSANLAVALLHEGVALLEQAGVPHELARVSLARLLKSQAENAIATELADALTGPIARGDAGTLERHLAAIRDVEVRDLYRALSRVLIERVVAHDAKTRRALLAALTKRSRR